MSNMRRILFTNLFLLLMAVPGWAGDGRMTTGTHISSVEDPRTYTKEEISKDIREVMKEYAPQLKHDRECLAKMESAMKAMEPYIEPLKMRDTYRMQTTEFVKYMEEWRRAARTWDATKEECIK